MAPEPASAARELVDAYADACPNTPFAVGGSGAKELEHWIVARGGKVIPANSSERRKLLDQLLSAGRARNAEPEPEVALAPKARRQKPVH